MASNCREQENAKAQTEARMLEGVLGQPDLLLLAKEDLVKSVRCRLTGKGGEKRKTWGPSLTSLRLGEQGVGGTSVRSS